MQVQFDGGLLEHVGPRDTARALTWLLRALVECNLAWLREHPDAPHPYRAGIEYRRETPGQERWKSIPKILADGFGDCEDLACYLAAYLVHHGRTGVRVVVRWKALPSGGRLYHILVRTPEGYRDPSRKLGM